MEDLRLSKVDILIQQEKYREAETILKDLLATDTHNTAFLALLAQVYLCMDETEMANTVIDSALALAPDSPALFYIKAKIAAHASELDKAEMILQQAIRLDPGDADYFALLAFVKVSRKDYQEALIAADTALAIDAEHILALNSRSKALLKLKRSEESFETIQGALREDPANAYTHANYGWGLLEKGAHKKALEHFEAALKNDPDSAYAQSGMIEALKARNPLYRLFLQYSLFMSNLTSKYQWGVLIGFYIAFRLLSTLAKNNSALQPYLLPLLVLLAFFAFSTWIIEPVSNLFLLFNRYGRYLLGKNEKMSANFVAGSFALFLSGVVAFFLLKDIKYLSLAIVGFGMMLPFSVMFALSKKKNALLVCTITMAVAALFAIAFTFATDVLFNGAMVLFVLCFVAFQWVANFFIIRAQ